MTTFDDLEREVSRLRREVRRLEGGNAVAESRQVVSDIIADGEDERLITAGGSEGGFSAACARPAKDLNRQLEAEAIRELQSGSVDSQAALKSFHQRYQRLGYSRRLELISSFDKRR